MIENEIALTCLSENPQIVKYYEAYEHMECLWLVVELMTGNLTDLIQWKPGEIPEPVLAYIIQEMTLGISFLHK